MSAEEEQNASVGSIGSVEKEQNTFTELGDTIYIEGGKYDELYGQN